MAAQAARSPLVGQVVAPGDVVLRLPEEGVVHVGQGLRVAGDDLVSQRCGAVRQTHKGRLWVEGRQKRYIPSEGDSVIGVVRDRHAGETWSVDVGGPFPAQLPFLAFEGATRRNRPQLRPGDVVYARVVTANKDMDAELACTDAGGRAAQFGPLQGGLLVSVPSSHARALVSAPRHYVLAALEAARLDFELAVGANGRVLVKAPQPAVAVLVSQAVKRSEALPAAQIDQLVQELRQALEV